MRAILPAAAAAVFGLIACQGPSVPPRPPVAVGPPVVPDAQPAVDAPLFLGQNAFPAPLANQADFGPGLATMRTDGGNTGVSDGPAPLGRAPVTGSASLPLQPPLLWDTTGDLTAGCRVEIGPGLIKDCLAAVNTTTLSIGARWLPPGQDLNLATAVVDGSERIIVTSRQGHLFMVGRPDAAGNPFDVIRDIDLGARLAPGQTLLAAVPDSDGNLWFVTEALPQSTGASSPSSGATVGYVTVDNQVVTTALADQTAETGFAVDQGNVYLATAPALAAGHTGTTGYVYGFTANAGQVQTLWRESYDSGSGTKPGGVTRGTASSVLLLGSQYLAVTDNADNQAHLLVFLRGSLPAAPARGATSSTIAAAPGATTTTGSASATTSTAAAPTTVAPTLAPTSPTTAGIPTVTTTLPAAATDPRLVCQVGLFTPGASAVTSAAIAYSSGSADSVIVANGLNAPPRLASPSDGGPANSINQMASGLTRVDITPDGLRCQTSWTVPIRLKSAPVLSGTTGLVYGYTQDEARAANGSYVWYFVALDYRTGRIIWQQRAGAGSTKNDNRQAMILGANGVLYQTLPLGMVWMRDVAQRP